MSIINMEIKAQTPRGDTIRKTLIEAGALFRGTDHQTDTYLRVPGGRVKLREGNIENQLIHYRHANQKGPKQADILLCPSLPGNQVKRVHYPHQPVINRLFSPENGIFEFRRAQTLGKTGTQ